jgi:hypothetical protein
VVSLVLTTVKTPLALKEAYILKVVGELVGVKSVVKILVLAEIDVLKRAAFRMGVRSRTSSPCP